MSSVELKPVKFDEICLLVTDGTHDSPKLQSDGVPFIKGKHISSGNINFQNCDYISEADHKLCIKRVRPQRNDVLLSNIGSVGDCAQVKTDEEFSIKNVALLRPNTSEVDENYFFYLFKNPKFKADLLNLRAGSAQQFISLAALRSFRFPVIENLQEQSRIGAVLLAYDDLIEKNQQRIALLEESARLLYREWFVHFRFPGYEHVKIVDGVPETLEVLELGDFCKLRGGNAFKTKFQGVSSGDYPFIKVGDMNSAGNSVAITESDNWVSEMVAKELKAKPFPSGTIIFAKIGEALKKNRVRIAVKDTIIDNNMMGAIPDEETVSPAFLHYLLSSYDIASHASGAAVPFLTAGVLSKIKFPIPNKTLRIGFETIVEPIQQQIANLQVQITSTAKARDLLLPRLMDGKLEI